MNWKLNEERLSFEEHYILDCKSDKVFIIDNTCISQVLFHKILDFNRMFPNASISYVSESNLNEKLLIEFCNYYEIEDITFYKYNEILKLIECENNFNFIVCDDAEDLPKCIIEILTKKSQKIILKANGSSQFVNHPIWKKPPAEISEIEEINDFEICKLNNLYKNDLLDCIVSGLSEFMVIRKNISLIRVYNLKNNLDEIRFCWDTSTRSKTLRPEEKIGVVLPDITLLKLFLQNLLELNNKPSFLGLETFQDFSIINEHLKLNSIDCSIMVENQIHSLQKHESQKILLTTYSNYRNFDFDIVLLPFLGKKISLDNEEINFKLLFSKVLHRFKHGVSLKVVYSGEIYQEISDFFKHIPIITDFNDNKDNSNIIF